MNDFIDFFYFNEKGMHLSNFNNNSLEDEVHQELAELKDILTETEYNNLFQEQLNYKRKEANYSKFITCENNEIKK